MTGHATWNELKSELISRFVFLTQKQENWLEEFYNKCHSDADGKFCEDDGPDHDGKDANGQYAIDGVHGYDRKTGKAVPGTDAWLEAHGITRKIYETRPYTEYTASKTDPELQRAYSEFPKAKAFFNRTAEQSGQSGGLIMEKHPAPGDELGPIAAQIRPNASIVTNPAKAAYNKKKLENAQADLERYRDMTPAQIVKVHAERVKHAQAQLEYAKTATPASIRKEADDFLAKTEGNLKKAQAGGDLEAIKTAKKEVANAKRAQAKVPQKIASLNSGKTVHDAERGLAGQKAIYERAILNPVDAKKRLVLSQENTVKRLDNRYKKSAAKYVFAPGANSARIDVHQDPQNLKNLTQGKGRIYFAMEGNIKNDAVLTALKKEDPTAAVVNVPSVTLWQNSGLKEFTERYARGREVVLIPDADGVTNSNVMAQAKGMEAALRNFGAGDVILAAPPLVKAGRTRRAIDDFDLPSGLKESRKGVDDHLGAGRGTLGEMEFVRSKNLPRYDLSEFNRPGGINKNSIKNTEDTLSAISSFVGPGGSATMPKKLMAQSSGLPISTALDARKRLVKEGIIKVEFVFDQDALSRGIRNRNPDMSDDRLRELVRKKIVKEPNFEQKFVDVSQDESPVITILQDRFRMKDTDIETGTLSSLSSWKPPRSFKGWTSPVTGLSKTEANAKRGSGMKITIQTKAGAEKFGRPIGTTITLSDILSTTLDDSELVHG